MRECGHDSAEEIENDKSHMPEPFLDIIAEYPEIEHIPDKMKQSAVHEHGGEYSQGRGYRLIGFKTDEVVRYSTITENNAFAVLSGHQLHDENQYVQAYDKDSAERGYAYRVVIFVGYHQ